MGLLNKNFKGRGLANKNQLFSKISINLETFWDFISFNKLDESTLLIKGFFGATKIIIPVGIFLEILEKSKTVNIFFYNAVISDINFCIKSFYYNFIFALYGVIFCHFVDISIKGVGYRFELKNTNLLIFHGNVLPSSFKIPDGVQVLTNSNTNSFSICGNNYEVVNNFIGKMRKVCSQGRYKEVGLFYLKRL